MKEHSVQELFPAFREEDKEQLLNKEQDKNEIREKDPQIQVHWGDS